MWLTGCFYTRDRTTTPVSHSMLSVPLFPLSLLSLHPAPPSLILDDEPELSDSLKETVRSVTDGRAALNELTHLLAGFQNSTQGQGQGQGGKGERGGWEEDTGDRGRRRHRDVHGESEWQGGRGGTLSKPSRAPLSLSGLVSRRDFLVACSRSG